MAIDSGLNSIFNKIGGKQNAILALVCILMVSIICIHLDTANKQVPMQKITEYVTPLPTVNEQQQMDDNLNTQKQMETALKVANEENDNFKEKINNLQQEINSLQNENQMLKEQKQEIPDFKVWGVPIVDTRNDFGVLLESENKKVGLEVGVQSGVYSEIILNNWINCEKYILLDPWIHQEHYDDFANVDQNRQNALFDETKNRLKKFEDRGTTLEYIRDFSENGRKLIPDDSLDFIYIDARHDYKAMDEDLNWFWPKLKKGGIFAGHDFCNANEEPEQSGQDWCTLDDGTRCENNKAVKAAVEEFAVKHQKQVVVPRRETSWVSWYLRK